MAVIVLTVGDVASLFLNNPSNPSVEIAEVFAEQFVANIGGGPFVPIDGSVPMTGPLTTLQVELLGLIGFKMRNFGAACNFFGAPVSFSNPTTFQSTVGFYNGPAVLQSTYAAPSYVIPVTLADCIAQITLLQNEVKAIRLALNQTTLNLIRTT